ncbi:MAG: hypothetical protein AB1428_04970 [Bacteroidota bacterium]
MMTFRRKLLLRGLVLLLLASSATPALSYPWEFGMVVRDNQGNLVSRTVYLYEEFDLTAPYRQAVTSTLDPNFRCDIEVLDTPDPTWPAIEPGTYYIRIGERYAKLVTGSRIEGPNDPDFEVSYSESDATFHLLWTHRSGTDVGPTQTWTFNTVAVRIDQKNEQDQTVGTVQRFGSEGLFIDVLPLGQTFDFSVNSTQVLRADQNLYSGQKYNKWSKDDSVTNHRPFVMTGSFPAELVARLKTAQGNVSIKAELLDAPGTIGGTVDFRDPWYIDYDDPAYDNTRRNRGMYSAVFRSRDVGTAGFHPDFSTPYPEGMYNGVFLNENVNWLPDRPNYSVGAPATQSISGIESYFLNWGGSGVSYQNGAAAQTGVVFTQSGATATAIY